MGCQDNDGLLSDNIRKSSHANSQTITVEEAKRQAIGFVNNLAMSTRSDAEKEIGDVYVWRKDQIYRMRVFHYERDCILSSIQSGS